nr:MAG TPA: hypothetical protein [Bacteriophage sp.]
MRSFIHDRFSKNINIHEILNYLLCLFYHTFLVRILS